MGTIKLRPVERELCRRVAHGDHFDVPKGSKAITAKVLRHIVLRLPLIETDHSLLDQIRKIIKDVPDGRICGRTAVGLSIENATIEGRLDLSSAREEGGAICPLTFVRCHFRGGFSGAEGHFSRLSFNGCTFSEAPPADEEKQAGDADDAPQQPGEQAWPPPAPVDLSGAVIESDLEMTKVRPHEGAPFFWIAAVGARIHGRLLLDDAVLRVPRRDAAPPGEAPPDALDLALAEVGGDLWFERGESDSRINGRSLRVRGNVWFSGAEFTCRDGHRTSLFLQGARIGGALLIQAWQPKGAGSEGEDARRFVSHGEISLLACRVGVSLIVEDVDLHAGKRNCLNLSGVQVQNSLQIGGRAIKAAPSVLRGRIVLTRAEVRNTIHIKEAQFGNEPDAKSAVTIEGCPLSATHLLLRNVKPIEGRPFSLRLRDAQLERLESKGLELSGSLDAQSLDCRGEMVLDGRIAGPVELDDATIGGSLDLSCLRIEGEGASLSLRDVTIGRCLKLRQSRKDAKRAPFHLDGAADLRGATCGTLDDNLGRSWDMPRRILMNNFVYHRTGTPADGDQPKCRKHSDVVVADWLRGRRAEGRFPWKLVPRGLVPDRAGFWHPWQLRRNWIFLQYEGASRDPQAIARHKVLEEEYQPQPFEQAIRVARAEGRDSAATNFEILKQRIEWRHSNDLMRWGLGILAITLAGLWLVIHETRWSGIAATIVATAVTIGLMIYASRLYKSGKRWMPVKKRWFRLTLLYILFFVPAALILIAFWRDDPLRFLQALMIFAAVRLVSDLAHAVMRFGFGYLRRPVYAIGTLIAAFLVGWAGVAIANHNRMLVIDTAAIADHVREDGTLGSPVGATLRMNLHCGKTIKQPLYALDVLIPLLDLREESRCKVGRVETPPDEGTGGVSGPAPEPGSGFGGLLRSWRALTVQNEFFWAVAKALYALAGWFLVSLAILTFANIHRGPAEAKQAP